ncbi:MAG TPA: primosomal protein N' [Phycisphaerales bacterium]|nr:primosomal protein N' [Phycisphaerales bacterium]
MPGLFASEKAVGFARVVVERGVDRYPDGLTYAITADNQSLQPGDRVIVPLGRGDTKTAGYILDIAGETELDADTIKTVLQRDASAARLPSQLLALAKWISSYYCAPIGMTLASMLPAAVKRNVGAVRRTMIDFGDPIPLDAKLNSKQRAVLEALTKLPEHERPVEARRLAELAGLQTSGSIKKLIERGLLEVSKKTTVEAAWIEHALDARAPQSLTGEQQRVIDAITARLDAGFSTHLLYGVTGSGKTEVYIQLIRRVVESGKVGLMLVPEIALTPQTGGRLIGRFPNHRVAVLHSGLTAAQRHQQWVMASDPGRDGAHIVLGARSAVFAPIPDERLGLIIVDEEHDGSYKQDQVPRYHGRDVAIRRAQLAGCPIVLGSATPSLESWHNAHSREKRGGHELHRLPHRAPGLTLPAVRVVDFREQMRQRAHQDKRVHLIGPALQAALGRTLESGGQALLLLNRRGYASYIACTSRLCGWTMTCDHCDVTVVYHADRKLPAGGYVRCHHCLSEQKLPVQCPECGKGISIFGLGVQRVEEELSRTFPQLVEGRTMLRIDSDSMQGSRAFHDALRRFGEGEIRLLLGTQMIAKGLDFPGVKLVGVINADTSINLPDFRAAERTFEVVNQVAGRCGRGADAGLTIVQTFNPQTPAIQLAAKHDFEGFAQKELATRQRSGLPPITRMVRFVVRDEDHVECVRRAKALAEGLEAIAKGSLRIRGPAPCPISRIADMHRQQVEVIGPSASSIQNLLAAARSAGLIRAGAELAIDVDPIALM